jgi:hypothetical protein
MDTADDKEGMGPELDRAIVSAGILAEIALLALLGCRRIHRTLPVFFAYIAWGVMSDSAMLLLQYRHSPHYVEIFMVEMSLDSALQYGVLVELTWSVLRPFRVSLPRGTLTSISALILMLGAAAWPVANLPGFSRLPPPWGFLEHLQVSIAVLRVLFFAILAAGSHLMSMGWRDRELQVATGLGGFSLASLAGSIVHTYQSPGQDFHIVDVLVSASYVVSMLYWIVSFAQKEASRHDFTPQMQGFLSALARSARAQRTLAAGAASGQVDKLTP